MDHYIEDRILLFFYAAISLASLNLVIHNIEYLWLMLLLSGLYALLFSFRNILLNQQPGWRRWVYLSFLGDIILLLFMGGIDQSGAALFFSLISISDAIIFSHYLFSALLTGSSFLIYISTRYGLAVLTDFDHMLQMSYAILAYTGVYCLMCLVRYSAARQEQMKSMHFALKQKTKQLEDAYLKLKETSADLEEVTILRERNRIAREIHDTVGHTLTTVLIEMEVAERLLQRDGELAREKIGLAKGQVRKGLGDLRESVSVLKAGHEMMDLKASLRLLIDETMKHAGVIIRSDISELPVMTEQQEKAIYRALQEGLANGIRHGGGTAFIFQLQYEASSIRFLLQDNGKGTDRILYGFGLTAMQQRVKEAGGEFSIRSRLGEGFGIDFRIPVRKEPE